MTAYKILFSNIGYARGIDGSLWAHFRRIYRHVYCSIPVQQQVLGQLKNIITSENPDLCCFVEVDTGSKYSGHLNQMDYLADDDYTFFDVADKYGPDSRVGRMPLHQGKSNGFLARSTLAFEKSYFAAGTKKLLYHISLPDGTHLIFAHFSLRQKVRAQQFAEISKLVKEIGKDIILLADFNIMNGFSELAPLLAETGLHVVNSEEDYTFRFHRKQLTLDLCLCSASIAPRIDLKIIPQPFSDHAALLVELKP